jgi:hypothetical protein
VSGPETRGPQSPGGWRFRAARRLRASPSNRLESQVALWAIALIAPGAAFGLVCIWLLPTNVLWRSVASVVLLLFLTAVFHRLIKTIEMPLRALANVVEAYRGGDYTIRGTESASPCSRSTASAR